MMKKQTILALSAAALCAASSTLALAQASEVQTELVPVKSESIAGGLVQPWGLDFLPDGSAVVTEKAGTMRLLVDGALSEPIEGLPEVSDNGQGGLLDVAAAPDFATSNLIYFSYSEPGDGGVGTAVARGKLVRDGAAARLDAVEVIFSMAKKTGRGQHFGSRLTFAPDGKLFVTVGERGDGMRAQDPQDSAGSVLRINPDGTIPADNPSPDGSAFLPQIWSIGHRNPQGAVFDTVTNAYMVIEHGAKGGDEINGPEAGRNYGWPEISYGVNYNGSKIGVGTEAPGFEQPLHYWDPSIAPSGLITYQGEMFPEWNGDMLTGSLKFALVSRLDRDETGGFLGEERLFEGQFGRIRDVNLAPDGSIWLLTDEEDGQIVRLSRGEARS